ncbi:MAG TPA: DUF6529 family protein [Ktedonobacterales bacterium]|nr:DUF6529 family protein [Ktedonobacterales bacterium]
MPENANVRTLAHTIERPSRQRRRAPTDPTGKAPVRLQVSAALAVGALVTVSVGLLARHMYTSPHAIPYFHLFFSSTIYMKAWIASAVLVLSFGQLVWAAGMYGLFRITPPTRFYQVVHRWSGRGAILLTLPVAFNCLFELGITPMDRRILIHSILGAFIYGVFVAKFLLIRIDRAPGWLLPIMGSALFATILGLWLTSAYWWFHLYGWRM